MQASQSGTQKPYPGIDLKWAQALSLKGSRGETLGSILKVTGSGCLPKGITLPQAQVTFYEMPIFTTTQSSYTGAPVGDHYDPLIVQAVCAKEKPSYVWMDVAIAETADPGKLSFLVGSTVVTLTTWKMVMPKVASLPTYSELTTWYVLLGHYGKWAQGEAELGQKYLKEMVAHRVYPYKNWVTVPTVQNGGLAVDSGGTGSFKNMVVNSTPAGVFFPSFDPKVLTQSYLQATEKTIGDLNLKGKSFAYVWDEPSSDEMSRVLDAVRVTKTYAPSLQTWVTTEPRADLAPFVDFFVPVMDFFGAAGHVGVDQYIKPFGLYTSCMAHGCDSPRSGQTPDLVVDRPSIYARVFPWVSYQAGASFSLYYSTVEAYKLFSSGKDPWVSNYIFSGNGDGTLFYPGRPGEHGFTEHGPVPSIRLKLLREASFDGEYLKWMAAKNPVWLKDKLTALIKSPRDWSKDFGAYQALRDEIGAQLGE